MSDSYPEALKNLIASFSRLPGVGPKTAQRLSFFLIKSLPDEIEGLINSLTEVKQKIHFCSRCGFYTENELCSICQDSTRESTILCVVERPQDVLSIEKTGYRGLYHVLQGVLSPLSGVGPEDLTINQLMKRIETEKFKEVILATNPSLDGEATAYFIARKLRSFSIRVTMIARGLPLGGDMEFADEITLTQAFEGRRDVHIDT
ncbi:MAG TPA: recombination mediator RecR [Atribacter sp.]|uniref:Recombination protein RecR n=1 Tax=Candidatus Atribacter allofermentans TaxID=1852833 RepID=A0A1V5SIA3_9BACT|nr:recombination mediator RecR [Atribacter sp.]MDD3714549.1 recombination mediator RecR [Atribacterota bacterium]OQA54270.1 MAG: Recombination protein RecR [Candidatus Atribacteria bacterium ADurb.Bin276]HHT09793.1 recombination protein RecR [Candidatus Atribacteria bacterium]MDI9595143.1 recombination mediator RecR [Atribacterota bacterium]HOT05456.1 recombination mediator RecR [Atribacter sp.]